MKSLTIGHLASASGVNLETVRYYERRGLLPKPRVAHPAIACSCLKLHRMDVSNRLATSSVL
jgi:hypothetical protein